MTSSQPARPSPISPSFWEPRDQTAVRRLARAQDDFQFDEIPEPLHTVKVDASLAHEVEPSLLADDAQYAQRGAEDVTERVRFGRDGNRIIGISARAGRAGGRRSAHRGSVRACGA